jgi:hypothetical protein
MTMQERLKRLMKTSQEMYMEIGEDLAKAGGVLHCDQCGNERPVGDATDCARYTMSGWPTCCNSIMRWIQAEKEGRNE